MGVPDITAAARKNLQNRDMAARILAFPKPATLVQAVSSTPLWDIPRTTASKALPSKSAMEAGVIDAGLGCVRGTLRILVLEGATAVVIYGIWMLSHLLR